MRKLLSYIVLFVALCLMAGCYGNKAQRLRQLEQLEAQNSADEPMLNDSLAEELADYFDRHGTANERMRAKYILGRTYYDIGELPRALETYYEAADCADTTAADCDFAKLSRVHAQMAVVFEAQLQPRKQLRALREAVYYARKANDTLIAIECYAQQANAYQLLHNDDSVILIKERAAEMYCSVGWSKYAARTLGSTLMPLIRQGHVEKAKKYLWRVEIESGDVDQYGNIAAGREIIYYAKGNYYLAVEKLDSAEYMFRKELCNGKDLNNQIAGCKGLLEVYKRRKISDSIAKYASLGYDLNDSAYSLAEMENIQKLTSSYDYGHHKLIAEQKRQEANRLRFLLSLVVSCAIIILLLFSRQYRIFRKAALDYRLRNSSITRHLREMAKGNVPQYPSLDDWKNLRALVEREIPEFPKILNTDKYTLSDLEYDICLLIRVNIHPADIAKLKRCTASNISNIRKRLLFKIYNREGSSEEFDDEIGKIGY